MEVNIRALTTADAQAVLDIHGQSFAEAWQNIDSLLHLHSTVGWIAFDINVPIGFILWQLVKGEADVLSFAVLAAYRKQGVGQKLYSISEQTFLTQGIMQLHLEVAQTNKGAIQFYQKQGFVRTGMRKNYYSNNNQRVIHAFTFSKTLKLE